MSINSKQKGNRGERELANYLKSKGLSARRGQQFQGSPESPDVICDDWPHIHIEVKRAEKLNINSALSQSMSDSREDQIPIVAHRKNREDWKVTLSLDDFIELVTKKGVPNG